MSKKPKVRDVDQKGLSIDTCFAGDQARAFTQGLAGFFPDSLYKHLNDQSFMYTLTRIMHTLSAETSNSIWYFLVTQLIGM